MLANFDNSLLALCNSSVQVSADNSFPESDTAAIALLFSNGTKLRADYWRLIDAGRAGISSFDHLQQYGLTSSINAVQALKEKIEGRLTVDTQHKKETGDLIFEFTRNTKLQILNFTGYEVWEIEFPNGSVEYSNYAK